MIHLKEIHAKNFRAWKELDLIDLDTKELCLICGINGSGKSSIRHIVEYCILDTVSDDIPLNEFPRNEDTECEMSILLEQNGDNIKITKYRNHKKYKNKIILEVNEDDSLTKTDRADTQKEITALLNTDNVLLSTIFSQYSPSFAEAKDSDRKGILYKYLSLDKYTERQDKAKAVCKDIETSIEGNHSTINSNLNKINEAKEEIEGYKNRINTYEGDKTKRIADLLLNRERLQLQDTTQLDKRIVELNKSIIQIDETGKEELETTYRSLRDRISQLNAEKQTAQRELANSGNNICPIFKDNCDRLVVESDGVKAILSPKIESLTGKLNKITTKYTKTGQELEKISVKLQENTKIENEIRNTEFKLNTITIENQSIDTKRTDIDNRIKEISKEENPYITVVEQLNIKKEKIEQEIEETTIKIKELEDKYKYYKFWSIGYSKQGLPNLKIEQMLDGLEDKTNEYLSKLGNVSVELSGQTELKSGRKDERMREKIDYRVVSEDGKKRSYHSFSGGEKQRVRIADMFAISDLMGKFNFLMLDEVLEGSVDSKGKDDIGALLRLKEKEGVTLFVVSHDLEIQSKFDNVIQIEKVNGISKLV